MPDNRTLRGTDLQKKYGFKKALPSQVQQPAEPVLKGGTGPLQCPHCAAPTISAIRKILLGPVFRSTCSNCHRKWRISNWSVIVALLTMFAIPILFLVGMVKHLVPPSLSGFGTVFIATLTMAAMVMVHVVPVKKA